MTHTSFHRSFPTSGMDVTTGVGNRKLEMGSFLDLLLKMRILSISFFFLFTTLRIFYTSQFPHSSFHTPYFPLKRRFWYTPHVLHSSFTLRIFHTPRFVHSTRLPSSFSTFRFLYSSHFPHSALWPVVEHSTRSRRVVGSYPIWDSVFFRVLHLHCCSLIQACSNRRGL